MIEADQSFVNNDRSDLQLFEADRTKRKAIIHANFDLLLEVTNQDGFPIITETDKEEQTCRYRALTMTMIHAAQLFPERFFGPSCIAVFSGELEVGRLDRALLERASFVTIRTMEICEELEPQILQALKSWRLDPTLLQGASFISCEGSF